LHRCTHPSQPALHHIALHCTALHCIAPHCMHCTATMQRRNDEDLAMGPNTPALSPEAARSPGQLVARLPQGGFDDLVALAVPRGGSRPRPAAGDGPAPATRSATGCRTATKGCAPKVGRAKRSRPGTTAASRRTPKSGWVHREKGGGRGRALGRTENDD
jgi:hypothetical protein